MSTLNSARDGERTRKETKRKETKMAKGVRIPQIGTEFERDDDDSDTFIARKLERGWGGIEVNFTARFAVTLPQ